MLNKKGNIFVISAPSGAGKTSLIACLLKNRPEVKVATSHTTRAPREGEVDGRHYHFVSTETFETMIGEGAFLEHARVHNHYYGTSTQEVETLSNAGYDVILEIDVQGAQQIRYLLPQSVSIFILPPSWAVLKQRLQGRGTESPEDIALRLGNAYQEMEQAPLFDYLLVNDDLSTAAQQLYHILCAARYAQECNSELLTSLLQSYSEL